MNKSSRNPVIRGLNRRYSIDTFLRPIHDMVNSVSDEGTPEDLAILHRASKDLGELDDLYFDEYLKLRANISDGKRRCRTVYKVILYVGIISMAALSTLGCITLAVITGHYFSSFILFTLLCVILYMNRRAFPE